MGCKETCYRTPDLQQEASEVGLDIGYRPILASIGGYRYLFEYWR